MFTESRPPYVLAPLRAKNPHYEMSENTEVGAQVHIVHEKTGGRAALVWSQWSHMGRDGSED